MVRIHPDPPHQRNNRSRGAIAQLGERLLCKQEVIGSIPIGSTSFTRESRGCSDERHELAFLGASSRALRLFFNNLE